MHQVHRLPPAMWPNDLIVRKFASAGRISPGIPLDTPDEGFAFPGNSAA